MFRWAISDLIGDFSDHGGLYWGKFTNSRVKTRNRLHQESIVTTDDSVTRVTPVGMNLAR